MKNDPALKEFIDLHYLSNHPLQRLKPRDAMRGGYVETFTLKFNQQTFLVYEQFDFSKLFKMPSK